MPERLMGMDCKSVDKLSTQVQILFYPNRRKKVKFLALLEKEKLKK